MTSSSKRKQHRLKLLWIRLTSFQITPNFGNHKFDGEQLKSNWLQPKSSYLFNKPEVVENFHHWRKLCFSTSQNPNFAWLRFRSIHPYREAKLWTRDMRAKKTNLRNVKGLGHWSKRSKSQSAFMLYHGWKWTKTLLKMKVKRAQPNISFFPYLVCQFSDRFNLSWKFAR